MSAQVEIPVKACGHCKASYTLAEWRALVGPLDKPTEDEREWRKCRCGVNIALDVAGLDELDLTLPADMYYELFPETERLPLRSAVREPWPLVVMLQAIAIGVLLVALFFVAVWL